MAISNPSSADVRPLDWPVALIASDLVRQRRTFLRYWITLSVLSSLAILFWPSTYTAEAKLMPPQTSQSTAFALASQVAAATGLPSSIGNLGVKNPGDLYVALLQSRSVADALVNEFDLRRVYWVKTYADARRKLSDRSRFGSSKEGIITIDVEDHSANRAAALANAYVGALRRLNDQLAVTEASQRRPFYQNQLDKAKADLTNAEIRWRDVQERTGLIEPASQARSIIEQLARLQGEIVVKEAQLQALGESVTPEHPSYRKLSEEIAALKQQLEKLRTRTPSGAGDVQLPTARLPEYGSEYIRAYRDFHYQETVYEMLAKQLEIARIDEAKQASLVQVIDAADIPERRTWPKPVWMVPVAVFLSALTAVGILALRGWWSRHVFSLATERWHS